METFDSFKIYKQDLIKFNKKNMNAQTQLNEFVKTETGNYVVPIEDACENNGEYTEAYPIGFPIFDKAMQGGVRAGDLIVITGLSGEGKTSFSQCLTKNLSEHFSCLWFSYEVVVDNLVAKFRGMGIDFNKKDHSIFVPKKIMGGDLSWIKSMIKEAQDKNGVNMVFIDHIDFLKAPDFSNENQRRIVLRDICQELKNIARELKISIFLMVHVKKVQGREIEMQDIAESSGIYQLSDYVFAVRREKNDEGAWGAKQTKLCSNSIRLLKNRPFGDLISWEFDYVDNFMRPVGWAEDKKLEEIERKSREGKLKI